MRNEKSRRDWVGWLLASWLLVVEGKEKIEVRKKRLYTLRLVLAEVECAEPK
jgi:hypothetical protein